MPTGQFSKELKAGIAQWAVRDPPAETISILGLGFGRPSLY